MTTFEQKNSKLVVRDAKIIFRNFSGRDTKYDNSGKKTFCIFIGDRETADMLRDYGWYVKPLKSRNDEEEHFCIQVTVKFHEDREFLNPVIEAYTRQQKTVLDDESVGILDFADIYNINIVLSPYYYKDRNGESKISAYLKKLAVAIDEDDFSDEYGYSD